MTGSALPDWHRALGGPVISCRIKHRSEDFRVAEELGFPLSGDGEHDYVHIEKDGANTAWVARELARYARIAPRDVGYAGMKDRHAVTTQWFSVRRRGGGETDWSRFALEGVRIVELGRHRRKLRRGAHAGNRFRIALRQVHAIRGSLAERLAAIRAGGVPNYFGEQRFGRDGSNLLRARELFAGRRLSRGERGMALSAARSFLFNRILEDRVQRGTWNALLCGDCASLDGSGSIFRVERVDAELKRRIEALDIHPSGALWGSGELQTAGAIAERESKVVGAYPELARGLAGESLRMDRRALRLAVRDFSWRRQDGTVCLRFYLGRGGYATAVLREIAVYAS